MVRCIHLPVPQCRPGLLMPWDWFLAQEENTRDFLVLTEGCLRIKIHFCLCDVSSAQMAYLGSWILRISLFVTAYLFCDCVSCYFSGMCTFLHLLLGTQQMFAGTIILPQLTFPFSFLTLLLHEPNSPVKLDPFPLFVLPPSCLGGL